MSSLPLLQGHGHDGTQSPDKGRGIGDGPSLEDQGLIVQDSCPQEGKRQDYADSAWQAAHPRLGPFGRTLL